MPVRAPRPQRRRHAWPCESLARRGEACVREARGRRASGPCGRGAGRRGPGNARGRATAAAVPFRVRDPCCGGDGQGGREACPGSRLVGRVRWLEAMALGAPVGTTRTRATRPDRLGSNTIRGREALRLCTAPETCPVPER